MGDIGVMPYDQSSESTPILTECKDCLGAPLCIDWEFDINASLVSLIKQFQAQTLYLQSST